MNRTVIAKRKNVNLRMVGAPSYELLQGGG